MVWDGFRVKRLMGSWMSVEVDAVGLAVDESMVGDSDKRFYQTVSTSRGLDRLNTSNVYQPATSSQLSLFPPSLDDIFPSDTRRLGRQRNYGIVYGI